MPLIILILLAALTALRAVPHDLGMVSEGSVVNLLLVFGLPGDLAGRRAASGGFRTRSSPSWPSASPTA